MTHVEMHIAQITLLGCLPDSKLIHLALFIVYTYIKSYHKYVIYWYLIQSILVNSDIYYYFHPNFHFKLIPSCCNQD